MQTTNQKGFSIIIISLIILAIVVLVGGTYLFISNSNNNSNTNNSNINSLNSNINNSNTVNQNTNSSINQNLNNNTNTILNQNVNSATNQNTNISSNTNTDPTADWKTYRNEEIGIEFKYPPEWGNVEINIKNGAISGQQFLGSISKDISQPSLLFGGNSISYEDYGRGLTLYDFYNYINEDGVYKIKSTLKNDNYFEVSPLPEIKILNSIEAIIIENQERLQMYTTTDRLAYINLSNNLKSFKGIVLFYTNIPTQEVQNFDKIISTIKYAQ